MVELVEGPVNGHGAVEDEDVRLVSGHGCAVDLDAVNPARVVRARFGCSMDNHGVGRQLQGIHGGAQVGIRDMLLRGDVGDKAIRDDVWRVSVVFGFDEVFACFQNDSGIGAGVRFVALVAIVVGEYQVAVYQNADVVAARAVETVQAVGGAGGDVQPPDPVGIKPAEWDAQCVGLAIIIEADLRQWFLIEDGVRPAAVKIVGSKTVARRLRLEMKALTDGRRGNGISGKRRTLADRRGAGVNDVCRVCRRCE